jgi:ribosome-associated translation inhibitor RaiA
VRVRLRSQDVELAKGEPERIEQLVRLALGRHASRIASVEVRFAPSPRMHGAGRKVCRIRVRQRDGHTLMAEDHAEDVQAAAAAVSARLEARLVRQRSLISLFPSQHRMARGGGSS